LAKKPCQRKRPTTERARVKRYFYSREIKWHFNL
jgi:hypothetical protein